MDGKSSEGKEGSNLKRSNGSLGNLNSIAGKSTKETGKPSGASANGAFSQRLSMRFLIFFMILHFFNQYICLFLMPMLLVTLNKTTTVIAAVKDQVKGVMLTLKM